MKKIIFCVLLVGVVEWSHAQVTFTFGPRIGFNMGTMSYSPDISDPQVGWGQGATKSGRFGMMFGAVADVGFGKMFGGEMGLIYAMKGSSVDIPIQNGRATATITYKINELEIPILFKVNFMSGNVRPYAFAGPNIGIILSANGSVTGPGINIPDFDLKTPGDGTNTAQGVDGVSTLDFGIDFGGGVEYLVTREIGLLMDIRYSLGLSNIYTHGSNAGPAYNDVSWKTSGFQIFIGTNFHL